MKMANWFGAIILLAVCLLQPAVGFAVTLGQIDDFQDGTTQNWIVGDAVGNPVPPVNVPTGGPGGAGDGYLLLTADSGSIIGPDPGSRLAVINRSQWSGNYLTTGVNAISMWVKNLGATNLALRLYISDRATAFPFNAAVSTNPVLLPAGSGWTAVVFPISPGELTATRGNAQTALTNAVEIRIIHNPNPTFPPPRVVAQLGVDNIKAINIACIPACMPLLLD